MSFNYTDAITRVIEDVSREIPDFAHVRADKLAVSYTMARKRSPHGVYARTVPLQGVSPDRPFPGGGNFTFRGRDILYLVYFVLPRFHDQSFEEKVVTILHELYHMSPRFDGTLRIFPGRNFAHGHSRDQYEAHLEPLAKDYIRVRNGNPLLDFLRLSTEELARSHGTVRGLWVQMP